MVSDYTLPVPSRGEPHPIPEGIDGVRRMIAVARTPRHRALIALCGLCGLRLAEALSVRPSDFDFENMLVKVRGKGDRFRKVPVSPNAWEYMVEAVGLAFINGNQPVVGLHDRFARSLVTDLGVRAHLKRRVASHDLRATFATALYDETGDQRLVQEILGHAHGTTTEVYILASMSKAREAVARL